MLVLTRKAQQKIQIGDAITVTIVRVKGQTVRLGIEAPKNVRVLRTELKSDLPMNPEAATEDEQDEPQNAESPETYDSTVLPTHLPELASAMMAAACSTSPRNAQAANSSCQTNLLARRRLPGASSATLIRRPQRLGPAGLRSLAGRVR